MKERIEKDKKELNSGLSRRKFIAGAAAAGIASIFDWTRLAGIAEAATAPASGRDFMVLRPTPSCPLIAKPGDVLSAEFLPGDATGVTSVSLSPPGGGAPVAAKLEQATAVENGRTAYTLIPGDRLSHGAYDLNVTIDKDGKTRTITKPRAVWCLENMGDEFTFGILADYHVGDDRGKILSPEKDFVKLRAKILGELSAVKPDFVIICGDLTCAPVRYKTDYEVMRNELLRGLEMPVFVVPGNHDMMTADMGKWMRESGPDYWRRYMGAANFSFSYGRHRFVGMNTFDRPWAARDMMNLRNLGAIADGSMSAKQFDWLNQQLREAAGMDQTISVFGHHSAVSDMIDDFGGTGGQFVNPSHLMKTLGDSGVRNYYFGHNHINKYQHSGDLTAICTTTSGSALRGSDGWGFRIVEVDGDRFKDHFVEVEPHPLRGKVPAGTVTK